MTISKVLTTNRNTVPGPGVNKNISVKSGDFNPLVDAFNALVSGTISGTVTSSSLNTAHGVADATTTVTVTGVSSTSVARAIVSGGTYSTGIPVVTKVVPSTNTLTFTIANVDVSAALNGTVIITYMVTL